MPTPGRSSGASTSARAPASAPPADGERAAPVPGPGRALSAPGALSAADVRRLQRAVGNRATGALLAGRLQRTPSTWDANPELQQILSIPHASFAGFFGKSTWKDLKAAAAVYGKLGDKEYAKRTAALTTIRTHISAWIAGHKDTDENDRVRTIYLFLPKLIAWVNREYAQAERGEFVDPVVVRAEDEDEKKVDVSGRKLKRGDWNFARGGEHLAVYRGDGRYSASYLSDTDATTTSYLSFKQDGKVIELDYIEAFPKRAGIGTVLVYLVASDAVANGITSGTFTQVTPLAQILVANKIHPDKRAKAHKGEKRSYEKLAQSAAGKAKDDEEEMDPWARVARDAAVLGSQILQERTFPLSKVVEIYRPKFQKTKWVAE